MPLAKGHLVSPVGFLPTGEARCWGLPFTFSEHYAEYLSQMGAPAGTNYLLGTVVPSGELWVVHSASLLNATTATGYCTLGVYDGTTYYTACRSRYQSVTRMINWAGTLLVPEGWRVFARYSDCVAGDNLYADFLGYKMWL
jgi:hypothetical protein